MTLEATIGYKSILFFIILIIIGIAVFNFAIKKRLITPIILFIIGFAAKPLISSVDTLPFILLSLIIVVFDAGSSFMLRGFDNLTVKTLKLITSSIAINSILCLVLLYVGLYHFISLESILLSIFAGVLLTASTQHDLIGLGKRNHKESIVLEIEDSISNPIVIFLGVVILYIVMELAFEPTLGIIGISFQVIQKIAIECGLGILFGMLLLTVVIKLFKRDKIFIPAMVLAIVVFLISISFDNLGLISVLIMSMFFHNIISKRGLTEPYSTKVSQMAYIVIFLVMGYAARFSLSLILTSACVLILYLLMRHFLTAKFFPYHSWSFTMDCQKGLAIGAFASYFSLIIDTDIKSLIPSLEPIMQILIWVTAFSIIMSYATKYHDHFSTRKEI